MQTRWNHRLLIVVALIGTLNATYLTVTRLLPKQIALQCGIVGDCQAVQASIYSVFPPRNGIPVAYLGLAGFLVLLGLSVMLLRTDWLGPLAIPPLLAGLASGGLLFSAYLTYVEGGVLDQWCQWCIISAICMTIFWILSLLELRAWRQGEPDETLSVGASELMEGR